MSGDADRTRANQYFNTDYCQHNLYFSKRHNGTLVMRYVMLDYVAPARATVNASVAVSGSDGNRINVVQTRI